MNKRARRILGLQKYETQDTFEEKLIKKPRKTSRSARRPRGGSQKKTAGQPARPKRVEARKAQFRKKSQRVGRSSQLSYFYNSAICKRNLNGNHSSSSWVYHRLVMRELDRRSKWGRIFDSPEKGSVHISNDPSKSRVAPYIDGYLKLYSKWELGKLLEVFHGKHVPWTYFIKKKRFTGKSPTIESDTIWFMKPTHASQGKGIRVAKNPYSFLPRLNYNNFIVQKAVSPLLLYEGRKYDLRMWVVFVSPKKGQRYEFNESDTEKMWNPQNEIDGDNDTKINGLSAFIFHDGVVRITIKRFNTKEKNPDLRTHLTNYAYQSQIKGYSKSKCVQSFTQMPHYADIYSNIKDSLREMMPYMLRKLRPDPKRSQYWLAGFDYVIDANLRPWLLEINCNPGVSCVTRDVNIYKTSVPDLLDLAIIPLAVNGVKAKLGGYERVG